MWPGSADAEAAIRRLEATAAALTDTEALARLLLRAESVASSRIEGLEIGPRRLLRAEAALDMGVGASDVGAEEILGNIGAMGLALEFSEGAGTITGETLMEIHRPASQEHPAAGVCRARAHISELARWELLQSLLRVLRAAPGRRGAEASR